MSTMEPDEGAPSDEQVNAPRWDTVEAANPVDAPDAPGRDEVQEPGREDAPRWDEAQEPVREDAPRWDEVQEAGSDDPATEDPDASTDS
jgi:hypothetical protein